MGRKYVYDVPCTHPGGCDVMLPRNPKRKFDLCRPHLNASFTQRPETRARISAALKRRSMLDPAWVAERGRKAQAALAASKAADPELVERLRLHGQRLGLIYGGFVPKNVEKRTAKMRATKLAHVPLEYREFYLGLREHHMTAAERLATTLNKMEADMRAYHAERAAA